MRIERSFSDGGKQCVTLYGTEEEIIGYDMSKYGTGSFGVSPSLDVYYYSEDDGGTWTKNGEAMN